uniref:Uncharacterized protein n=1 Tax=viral metagenome TaxID=1070528 RepID=A0A6C0HKQ1_9ZZZZ
MAIHRYVDKILVYRIIAGILFIYIYTHLMALSNTDWICNIFRKLVIANSCTIILYLLVNLLIFCYLDRYIGVLLFIIIITQYRTALKEFFDDGATDITVKTGNDRNPYDIPQNTASLMKAQLGVDDRFKIDDVVQDQILKQIQAQIQFDPYKSNLAKNVINEIYSKYYNNSIFTKLKGIVDDSQSYIAAGNFKYLPEVNQIDYDVITCQNLNNNVQLGINPIIDGIGNTTRT